MAKKRTGKPVGRPEKRQPAKAAVAGIASGVYRNVSEAALAHIRDHFPKLADAADEDFRETGSPEAERFREFRDFVIEELERQARGSLHRIFGDAPIPNALEPVRRRRRGQHGPDLPAVKRLRLAMQEIGLLEIR